MSNNFKLHSSWYRNLVFVVGVIATIAYRIIIFLNHLPTHFWADITWYIGTIGFVWYFAHRYNIERQRAQAIVQADLTVKINKACDLSAEDKKILSNTLNSLTSTTAGWMYIVIFVASGLALVVDIVIRLNLFK